MPPRSSLSPTEVEALVRVRHELQTAAHGGKQAVLERAALTLGCTVKTVYRKLAQVGYDAGRARREDAGASAMSVDELRMVSGMLVESTRGNGKQLMTVADAIDILAASGKLQTKLSAAQVGRLLYQHTLHPSQLLQPTPSMQMRSLHPNHVWQLDASVCVLYYMRDGRMAVMERDQFYKNKPHNLARVINDLVTRYVITDHTSGVILLRYYLGGETAASITEFFLWAISERVGCPVHGVPSILMLDKGAANTSGLFLNLLRRLDVKPITHATGNSRAKGQVESAQNLVERHFEGRLRFMPQQGDLAQLNQWAERWQMGFNAGKAHGRHGKPRYEAWLRITAEQLRIAPPLELLRDLVTTEPETRRVANDRTISFAVKGHGSATYDLRYVPGVIVGQKVSVVVNAYRAPCVDVEYRDPDTGELRWMTVEPVARTADGFGFRADAPVIGQEMRTAAHTVADQQRNRIAREAYRDPAAKDLPSLEDALAARKARRQAYAGQIDAMADVDQAAAALPTYMRKRGTAMSLEGRTVELQPLSLIDAAKQLKSRLGEAYTPAVFTWLQARFPGGVPPEQIDSIAAQFTPAQAPPAASTGLPTSLRVVGGES